MVVELLVEVFEGSHKSRKPEPLRASRTELGNDIIGEDLSEEVPLMGVEGVVARMSATMRVVLTVDLIGQGVVVQVSREQVEPLD